MAALLCWGGEALSAAAPPPDLPSRERARELDLSLLRAEDVAGFAVERVKPTWSSSLSRGQIWPQRSCGQGFTAP